MKNLGKILTVGVASMALAGIFGCWKQEERIRERTYDVELDYTCNWESYPGLEMTEIRLFKNDELIGWKSSLKDRNDKPFTHYFFLNGKNIYNYHHDLGD